MRANPFGRVFQSMGQKMKTTDDNTAPADKKPRSARKQSRTKERLKIVEEYAASQMEVLQTVHKKLIQ